MFKNRYLNMSIKYKILIFFYFIVFIVASILGLYSSINSSQYIISKISSANIGVVKQLNNNVSFIQKDIVDISTNIYIDDNVQLLLTKDDNSLDTAADNYLIANNSLKFIMNIIASKSYISFLILYGRQDNPIYYEFTDMSTGVKGFNEIQKSPLYKAALSLDGSPLSFPLLESNNMFIQRSTFPKIGVCRIVKNFDNNHPVGFLVLGINESTLQELCVSNIQNADEGIMIVDNQGNVLSHAGFNFFGVDYRNKAFYLNSQKSSEGYVTDTIGAAKYLITYGSMANGWKSYYAVPMKSLNKEISTINIFTLIIVLACLVFSLPLMAFISSYLTAPIMKLLKSMKRFQQGNFDERVEFKYKDEIGQLGDGYNNMVQNIKELINKAYVLQIKEREAELNALQAQINPHFLYNTLDTIFWKAETQKEKEISEMVYSLAKLFRLSLNRGKSLTLVSQEKELLVHYLLLQKIRLKNNLNYKIDFDEEINRYVIPKLILQPFVENAILHGLGGRENGGMVLIKGERNNDRLQFVIEDDGVGMSPEDISKILNPEKGDKLNEPVNTSGYAVNNVNERLKILFKEDYCLKFISEIDKGTKVIILLPLNLSDESKGV